MKSLQLLTDKSLNSMKFASLIRAIPRLVLPGGLLLLGLALGQAALAAPMEVLHYWTSPSESAARELLQQALAKHGAQWQDFAIPGGGGESAYAVLQTRAIAGTPPVASIMEGPIIHEWAALGFLDTPYPPKLEKQWDAVLPPMVREVVKANGRYVALPIDLHRINWLWLNPAPFAALKLPLPQTWDEIFIVAPKLKAAGYIPFALGGQAWQDGTVFENMLLGMTDGDFYRQVFVAQNSKAILSTRMQTALDRFRALRPYIDPAGTGRTWPQEAALLKSGKAAMMIMGDWVKADLVLQGMVPGKTLKCQPVPGTEQYFVYNMDSFVLFRQHDNPSLGAVQKAMAEVIMDPQFQAAFNQRKGSIPVRMDARKSGFDSCSLNAMAAFDEAEQHNRLLPSMAHSMAANTQVKETFFQVINYFFTHPDQTAEQATRQLDAALRASRQ